MSRFAMSSFIGSWLPRFSSLRIFLLLALLLLPPCPSYLVVSMGASAEKPPRDWQREFPKANFSRHSVPFKEIISGGPPRDGIPAINAPRIVSVNDDNDALKSIKPREPVLSVAIGGSERAYPLRFLIWHEIVNDRINGKPIVATFCPLCNSAIVFSAKTSRGRELTFGTTGRLRNSDLVMYDRQTESWWQQFLGEAIVGSLTGERLKVLPSRLESWGQFKARVKNGEVALPPDVFARNYGSNPYDNYDSSKLPFLYRGKLPEGIKPLARVVSLEARGKAIALEKLRKEGSVKWGEVVIEWRKGQSSALDSAVIAEGKEVGSVYAWRKGADGSNQGVVYFVDFAFAFHAFYPQSPIIR